jgi:hypothetical protein
MDSCVRTASSDRAESIPDRSSSSRTERHGRPSEPSGEADGCPFSIFVRVDIAQLFCRAAFHDILDSNRCNCNTPKTQGISSAIHAS